MKDLAGQRFGRLVVISYSHVNKWGKACWNVVCDCGNTKCVSGGNLLGGQTKSCGCLRREILIKDLSGMKFGKLTAIEQTGMRKDGGVVWKCLCDCGNFAFITSHHLVSGDTRSCGCSSTTALDLTGMRFGRLVAIESTDKRSGSSIMWKCLCDCGEITYVAGGSLVRGDTRSCGCLRKESSASRKGPFNYRWNPSLTDEERLDTRHNPEYNDWRKAVYARDRYTCQKCGAKKNINAHHVYGYTDYPKLRIEIGNGITLCEDCHKEFHHIYGVHSTREMLEDWFGNLEAHGL